MRPAEATPRSLFRRALRLLSRAARDERGSASVEFGIGIVVVLVVTALAFDIYSLIRADTAIARIAATMADYVSRETAPDGDEIAALGQFLHEHELGAPTALVYVVSAVHQPSGGNPAVPLWDDDTVRFGEADATANLVQECRSRAQGGWQQDLLGQDPDRLTLAADDVVIVVEVCAKLLLQGTLASRILSGNIYRLHALPVRDIRQPPAAPTYAPEIEQVDATPSIEGEPGVAPSRTAVGLKAAHSRARVA